MCGFQLHCEEKVSRESELGWPSVVCLGQTKDFRRDSVGGWVVGICEGYDDVPPFSDVFWSAVAPFVFVVLFGFDVVEAQVAVALVFMARGLFNGSEHLASFEDCFDQLQG